jgi:hypothetical protein
MLELWVLSWVPDRAVVVLVDVPVFDRAHVSCGTSSAGPVLDVVEGKKAEGRSLAGEPGATRG